MRDNEIKIFEQGRERETIRGLTLSQMYVISAILKRCGISHKTFTYRDGQLASVDWVEAPDLWAALEETADCLEDVASGKSGWAWEEVVQQARAALAGAGE